MQHQSHSQSSMLVRAAARGASRYHRQPSRLLCSNRFHLQQFAVDQDRCAMKVTTDTLLLGAWARLPNRKCGNKDSLGLDIGTGTGTIALMLLQRHPSLWMHAVEADGPSADQAQENAERSPWADRMKVMFTSIQDWAAATEPKQYDLIVSNPPYYPCRNTLSPARRRAARTTETLTQEQLVSTVDTLLAPDGSFCVILPASEAKQFRDLAAERSLFLRRECAVKPMPMRPPKRILLEYGRESGCSMMTDTLTIHHSVRQDFTTEYLALTGEFHDFKHRDTRPDGLPQSSGE